MRTILGKDLETGNLIEVKDKVRQSGLYILGTQGQGKSQLIGYLIYQDMEKHYAVLLFDPHGDLITHLIAQMPEELLEKTFLLDMTDTDFPFGLNLFDFSEATSEIDRAMAVDRVMHIFERIWPEIKGVLLEKLLRYITLTFSEAPGHTLADIPRLLWDAAFRSNIVSHLTNQEVKTYWLHEYHAMTAGERRKETQALSNRLAAFLSVPLVKNIVCQQKTTINFQRAIQEHEILLINLPLKRMKDAATLIGTILLAQLHAVTFAFGELDWNERPSYSLYVDEFQSFSTSDFAELFQEGRKFGLRIAVAHQARRDLIPANRSATLTAGIIMAFQATPDDASEIAPLLLDSSIKLRPESIYPDVLRRLRLHEHQEIQEFFRRYVLPLQKQSKERESRQDLLELLQDMLYQAMKTQIVNEDFFQTYTQHMFPILGITCTNVQQKQKAIRARLRQQDQTLTKLTSFLTHDTAFEDYLIAYYSFYSGFTYPHTTAWYYQPFVPEAFTLTDTRFWDYVLGKNPHPYQHILISPERSLQNVMASLQEQASANDSLHLRDTPEKLLAEEKARIIAKRNHVLQQCWEAIAKLHVLKSNHAVYPAIQQFHKKASQVCLAGSLEQRGEPLFEQPIGSMRKRGGVDQTTKVEELVIQPLSFADTTSRDQLLAWLPAASNFAPDMRQIHYDVQITWEQIRRRYADLQKLHRLIADETAILKDYYAEIGKRLEHQELWKKLNDEQVDQHVWESLHIEADRNMLLSREMNSIEKFIQLRKNELRKKINQLAEERKAFKATVPSLEMRIAEEIAAIEEQQATFRNYVRHIIDLLIQDPGPLGEKRVLKESDVKETLVNLPKRQALVRVGGEIDQKPRKYTMQTVDARQAVKQDEAKQRLLHIRKQSRSKYGRPHLEVERGFRDMSMNVPGEDEHHDDERSKSWYEE